MVMLKIAGLLLFTFATPLEHSETQEMRVWKPHRKSIETITRAGGIVVKIGEHKEAKAFDASGLNYTDYEHQKTKCYSC